MAFSADVEAQKEKIRNCTDTQKLKALLESCSPEAHSFQPGPSEWSMVRCLQHLGDVEEMRHVRFTRMLNEDNPILDVVPPTPGERDTDDAHKLLARWVKLREKSLALLDGLTDEQWHRVGTQNPDPQVNRTQPAPTSVLREAGKIDHHSADHLQQMEKNLLAYNASQATPAT